jgi:hypothetical protein
MNIKFDDINPDDSLQIALLKVNANFKKAHILLLQMQKENSEAGVHTSRMPDINGSNTDHDRRYAQATVVDSLTGSFDAHNHGTGTEHHIARFNNDNGFTDTPLTFNGTNLDIPMPIDGSVTAVVSGTGVIELGGSTNKVQIGENGIIKLKEDGRPYVDINIPTANMQPGASAPSVGNLFGGNIRGWILAGGTSGISEELHASSEEINHYYAEGTDIELHLHFYNSTAIGTTNKGVTWYWEAVWTNDGEAATVLSGTVNYTYPDNTAAWTLHRQKLSDAIGTNKKYGSQLSLMFRRVRDANNTYIGGVHPSSIGAHVRIDQMGSTTISQK